MGTLLGLAVLNGTLIAQSVAARSLEYQSFEYQSFEYQSGEYQSGEAPLAIAQAATVTQADRAIFLIQNEAAIWFNTYAGNINVIEFGSRREDDQVIGYEAITERLDDDQGQLACAIDLDETVICQPLGIEANTEVVVNTNSRPCDIGRRQETLLDLQFSRQDSLIVPSQIDYAVRVYEAIDDQNGSRQVCMNVYNLQDKVLAEAIPVRVSSTATAYYSDVALNGIDHQVVLNRDNGYIYRQSQGEILLYEGYSR